MYELLFWVLLAFVIGFVCGGGCIFLMNTFDVVLLLVAIVVVFLCVESI